MVGLSQGGTVCLTLHTGWGLSREDSGLAGNIYKNLFFFFLAVFFPKARDERSI